MIQRLQLDEAQPSSLAITPIREIGESRDEGEFESLAKEFRDLLSQITGGLNAIPDQVSALGLALAQTQVVQRQIQTERVSADQRSTTEGQGDGDNQGDQGFDTFNQGGDTSRRSIVSDGQERRASGEGVASNDRQGLSDQNSGGLGSDLGARIVDSGDLNELSQLVLASDQGAQDGAELTQDNSALSDFNQGEQVDTTTLEHGALTDQGLNQGQLKQGELQQEEIKVYKKVESHQDQQQSEELVAPTTTTDAVADQGREQIASHKRAVQGDSEKSDQLAENRLNTQEINASHAGREQRPERASGVADRQVSARDAAVAEGLRGAKDGSKKVAREVVDHVAAAFDTSANSAIGRAGDNRSEASIQMALLRQAFESLRAVRADAADARAKGAPQPSQAITNVAETKASSGEAGARSSRSLTRPQITRMLERVESTLKEAARSRDGKTISLRLEPVDLGRVKVDVSLRDGNLHARIAPENQQVMQALREHSHELQGALRKLGLNVDTVSVAVTADTPYEEMNTGQQMNDGRSFQQERHELPYDHEQVVENTVGNELANDPVEDHRREQRARQDDKQRGAKKHNGSDHWVA
jgi:flagellar hook-length control protein FliK